MTQEETLEEAAKNYADNGNWEMFEENNHVIRTDAFIEGAKWQQEQDKNKYSEEDMKLAFETGRNFQLTGEDNFNELIKQFKKK